MCRLECPANVDIPKLMLEAKAAYVRTNGLTLHDWLLSASRHVGLHRRSAAWHIELGALRTARPAGYWRRPQASPRAANCRGLRSAEFLQQAALRRLHFPLRTAGEKVVYFVDTYANYFDTQLAEALLAVLRHNGIGVFVPREQLQAAMPMIAQGALEPARDIASRNVALLAETVRQGYTIVATEPSAVLALTHEYPILLDDDDDALVVAQHTQEACHYLWQLHHRGRLNLNFQPQRHFRWLPRALPPSGIGSRRPGRELAPAGAWHADQPAGKRLQRRGWPVGREAG